MDIVSLKRDFVVLAALTFFWLPMHAQETSGGGGGQTQAASDNVEVLTVCGRWNDDTATWEVYSAAADGSCEVIGSRRSGRSAAQSAVPVDVILGDDLLSYGDTSLDRLLASAVPSFNVSQGADAAMFIRPGTLRGLAPDAALVLMNGKRRHRGAVIALLGYGLSGGAQGVDLAAIPAIAVERIEVLRDGASAQYGSDAIAGAMNIVLRDANRGSTVDVKMGSYFEGDGDTLRVAGNLGLPLGAAGFANLSVEWKDGEPTVRSVQRADAQALIDAGNRAVPRPVAQVWGLPRLSGDMKLFGNFGFDVGETAQAYAFGNWAERQLEGGFYYRNPHTRGGVFQGVATDDGTPTVKVADLTGDGSGNCPPIRVVDNRADADALAAIRENANCYSLIERFPGGFTPQFGSFIEDTSIALGIRGDTDDGWSWDASVTTGSSSAAFYIHNTVNPQLLAQRNNIPTHYEVGMYKETDRIANLDFSKPFAVAPFEGLLNVAFGLEYRDETFEIGSGDRDSYYIDPNLDHGLAAQGFGIGSNGFPGFQPSDAGENTVRGYAGYLDLEAEVTGRVLVGAATRYEKYADFGDTLDGKLTTRLQLSDGFALRGAVSTGFRVPTAGQANLRNVSTSFDTVDGVPRLVDIAILPPTNPVARLKGARPLTPEQSTNFTVGMVFSLGAVEVTLDYYDIAIEDRIAFTSPFTLTSADVDTLLRAGVPDAQGLGEVRFFSNQQAVDTTGVDLVATWPFEIADGASVLTIAANLADVTLEQYNPLFTSDNRRFEIEDGRPQSRLTATWSYDKGPWRLTTRLRNYGEYYDAPTGGGGWGAYRPEPATLFDAELGVDVGSSVVLVVGSQNLFDAYPQENPNGGVAAFNGLPYPENSPVGFNGGHYYARFVWRREG